MDRKKISQLIIDVKKNLKVAEIAAQNTKTAADMVAGMATSSHSAAGDIEHAKNAANLNHEKVTKMKLFLKELEEALTVSIPEKIQPVCTFSAIIDGETREYVIVNNPIYMEGTKIISPVSPIGSAVSGKKVGESFSYDIDGSKTSGQISEIG